MSAPRDSEPIRETVVVRSGSQPAFDLFTAGMGTWWPLDAYSRAVNEFEGRGIRAERLVFQPRLGGSIVEHLSDGRVLPWAEVVAWSPPDRVVLAWHPHSQPEPPTELVVTFTARDGETVVELEHRGWEQLSEGFRGAMYEMYVRGWPSTLARFGAVVDEWADA